MARVVIDLKKSVEENAGFYFDKAKKARKKLEGAKVALQKSLAEHEALKKQESILDEKEKVALNVRKKEWFEKFRWFISSEGFLVVGGRDATTNEIIIKKHTEANDLVFHTDMAGSPFFVVKNGSKAGEVTIRETADATCTFSRAWKLGLANSSVFYVKPEQVSKEAKPGEYLTKGAFMIYGKTNYIENKINLAIGIYDGRVMAGPVAAVKKNSSSFVELKQGKGKLSDAAKKIKNAIGGELDEIIRAMPSGGIEVRK